MTHVFLVRVLAMCIIRVPYPEGPGASLTVLFFTFFFIEKLTSEILSGASLPKSTLGTFYFVTTVNQTNYCSINIKVLNSHEHTVSQVQEKKILYIILIKNNQV